MSFILSYTEVNNKSVKCEVFYTMTDTARVLHYFGICKPLWKLKSIISKSVSP